MVFDGERRKFGWIKDLNFVYMISISPVCMDLFLLNVPPLHL
jgi:hypothetical protein